MNQTTNERTPSAYITINRNRVKTYGANVYLKDGTNFEIELWNPYTTKVLAAIFIDGKTITEGGIIINPGQRIYLERWIDVQKKFKFSTYAVENSEQAIKAIQENGKVKVLFYNEVVKNFYPSYTGHTMRASSAAPVDPNPFFYTTCGISNSSFSMNISGANSVSNNAFNMTSIDYFSNQINEIETGRTEAGETSSQKLVEAVGDFNTWAFKNVEWKILPESAKPVEIEKIRCYCTQCGTRSRSDSWKFCPSCGTRIE